MFSFTGSPVHRLTHGTLAYTTTARTGEIGVRLALGATPGGVVAMIQRQGLVLIACGIGIGVPAAIAARRFVSSRLPGIHPADLMVIAIAIGLMVGAGLLAGFVPARRASRVDPVMTLRAD